MQRRFRHALTATCFLFCIATLTAGCASTSGQRARAGHQHQRALTANERAERAADLFDELDTNHDGFLTRDELMAGLTYAGSPELNPDFVMGLEKTSPKEKARAKAREKTRATRRLTQAEIEKAMAETFNHRDSNLEHRLSKDEFKKLVVERPVNESDDPWEPFM